MPFIGFRFRPVLVAGVLLATAVAAARAADDVVKEEEPAAPAQAPAAGFGGQMPRGRVIIMPGLRLQVGGQGQVQVQGVPGRVQGQGAEPAPGEVRKEPYLGVVTGEVSEQVRAQLDLPEGVGLSIDAVAAGSPAEKAGVRRFDVLHKVNDQVVCSVEQLTTLVKVAGAGTTVPLTLVRGGKEQVVEAMIEERVVPVGDGNDVIVNAMPGVLNLEQMIPPGFGAEGFGPQVPAEIERQLADALARARAGGMMPGFAPGVAGNVQVLTIGPDAQSATMVSDARGSVEIRSAAGTKTVTVRDPQGNEVHSGPLDTDEDFEKVPEEYRDWVREVDGGRPGVELPPFVEPEPDAEPETEAAGGSST